jgi:uncharacterized protein (DUF4415 family)
MNKVTKQQKEEIERLDAMSDRDIDTSDIPDITDWSEAVVGKFYRPVKRQITLRLDADMIEWFKSQDGKYQKRINQALREYMERHK